MVLSIAMVTRTHDLLACAQQDVLTQPPAGREGGREGGGREGGGEGGREGGRGEGGRGGWRGEGGRGRGREGGREVGGGEGTWRRRRARSSCRRGEP